MPVKRLGVASPAAYTDASTLLATADVACVASVIVVNKGSVELNATIYVEPVQSPGNPSNYVYIVNSLVVGVGQSFETFRFAINSGDTIYVRTSVAQTSFSINGVSQEDSIQPENIAQTLTNKVIRGVDNVLYLDKGITSERSGSAEVGYVRFNTETDALEVKTSTGWQTIGMV